MPQELTIADAENGLMEAIGGVYPSYRHRQIADAASRLVEAHIKEAIKQFNAMLEKRGEKLATISDKRRS